MKQLNEMTINELKVLAYDTLAIIEQQQNNVRMINMKIAELSSKDKTQNKEVK